jgi:hypothetical protein
VFYLAICTTCNTGLDGNHSSEECDEIMRVRKALDIPLSHSLDQIEMRAVLEHEKKTGKLPELADELKAKLKRG